MIRRVYADLPHFKNLDFHQGLNVLLAEKTPGATDKQTRNRAGKSSLLDVLHFLLGSNCDKDSIFRIPELRDAVFGMEFDLAGEFVRVERTGEKPGQVTVAGKSAHWPVEPTEKAGVRFLSNDNWKTVLGKLMFGVDEFEGAWAPSFRSLLSYFVRRDRQGGMQHPMMNVRQQRPADQQVNVSFLLGLDWAVPRDWQRVRDQESSLKQLRRSMSDGAFGVVVGSASQLKSALIVAQDRAKQLKAALSSFKVVEQYHELEQEASRLTEQLSQLADENVVDERYISELETVTVEETPPAPTDIDELFREVGVVLPGLIKKRFDEATAFHKSIIRNRRAYLESEVKEARRRIEKRYAEESKLDARRSELMGILKSSGALEHFVELQAELARVDANVADLQRRHDTAENLEAGGLKLRVERARLLERLRLEYAEQGESVQDAVLTFRDISSQLYEDNGAGTLTITPTEDGPEFDPSIHGDKSRGVNNMRIFCFDMMLMILSLRRSRSPGFLIHDSHLFDGVDDRQKGKALTVGAALAAKHGFQYIVTMNTDAVPPGFRVDEHALKVRLTDASEDGGLFGFRFG